MQIGARCAGVLLLSTLGIACRDAAAPARGTIDVAIASTGTDLDPDGYVVTLDSRQTQKAPVNSTAEFTGVVPGSHSVSLSNLASNCTAPVNLRSVTVEAQATVTTSFAVACVARTGSVRLTISTTGVGIDVDGYLVRIDDGAERPVATNDVVVLSDIHEGSHRLSLGGVASNCALSGGNQLAVNVAYAETTAVQVTIACRAGGTLKITTTTTGLDLDSDGYGVSIYNDDYYQSRVYTATVPANGSVSIPNIVAGEYSLDIVEGLATNCQRSSANPNHFTIATDVVTPASLDVVCYGKGTLTITGATTGVDLDPDGYTVNLFSNLGADRRSAQVPTNGSVSLPDIVGGPYMLIVTGWAANCELAGAPTRGIVVDDKGPTSTSVAVSCSAASRLAFVETEGNQTEIYTINSNGTGASRLTTNTASDQDPAWSPDGSMIAFSSNRDGIFRIYVMNADGSNQRVLSGDATGNARQPAWSPDGQKIAFVGQAANGDAEIYVMKADGSNPVRLTQSAGDDGDPAWSPDGGKIAFRSVRTGSTELWVMSADGSNVTRLTTTSAGESRPAWSPDGTRIVFATGDCDYYYGCYSDLFVMNADGSHVTRLTSTGGSNSPAWSPDGRWIAFVTCNAFDNCSGPLSMVKVDGTAGGTITAAASSWPAWRP